MEDQQIEGNNKMKKIEDYTADELAKKIQAIKAEREKTANALKRYEEELGRRKQEVPLGVPLGVPLEDEMFSLFIGDYQFGFASEESMNVFYERIKLYAEVLQKLAKGEHIDIRFLVPLMKKGWVAMDKDEEWFWYECKPFKGISFWDSKEGMFEDMFFPINIKPADNWEDSLMECGL